MSEGTVLTGKEEFVAQCVATGKTEAECAKIWDESHSATEHLDKKDFRGLVRENEMQKVKIGQLEAALREATDIIKKVNTERDAVTDARKYELSLELEKDTEGRLKHSELMKESLEELTIMKKAIDVARPKSFVSLSQQIAADKKKKMEPTLTVGEWDPDTKQYRGGIEVNG